MEFNVDKCFTMRAGRAKKKQPCRYILHGQELQESDAAKYLGLTLTSDLKWNKHINNITKKANSILGLIRRNLRIGSKTIKTQAYQALVRPHLEYASTVWDPHTQANIKRLEMVQLGQLDWESLAIRRRNARLCMMFKMTHGLAMVPLEQYLTQGYRGTRGSHTCKFTTIATRNDIYKYSFLPRTIVDWNSLPPNLVTSPSLESFRAGLNTLASEDGLPRI
jgi:hypothetical protein